MPDWLIAFGGEAVQWAPFGPLTGILAVALVEAIVLPARLWAKAAWAAAAIVCGVLAAAAEVSDHRQRMSLAESNAQGELAALRGLWTQWETVSQSLPSLDDAKPAAGFDTLADALASLSVQIPRVQRQIEALRTKSQARAIDSETAVKLTEYLRRSGPRRVVVSCAPDDVEAYNYANQLANILRAAGWEAPGPQLSADGGPLMAVTLYTRDPRSPDTARVLVDALTRFNIPYQAGIAPNDAIPDPATAELHVSKKP